MKLRNFYAILLIRPNATRVGIRRAWLDLAKEYHPDKTGLDSNAIMSDLNKVAEVLLDPASRAQYDAWLAWMAKDPPLKIIPKEFRVSIYREVSRSVAADYDYVIV